MDLNNLEIYKLAREISKEAWKIYEKLNWKDQKTIGDQWIMSIDSIGANIAEGFGRYYCLDKNRFNYNARGSLLEGLYWTELLEERCKITSEEFKLFQTKLKKLHLQLNTYIKSTKRQAE
ncbi:four helix bundle protein [Candidatus Peregrinibacteria bacterium]|nr:four helix bundle protein [Candidatus Peregrinibacteria bacterium]